MSKYETATYTVIMKEDAYEIRQYEALYTATIDETSYDANGFSQIFQYISGDNSRNEKIAMTTPVLNELKGGAVTTEFVMPQTYTLDSLPTPKNSAIQIKKTDGRLCASVTFSGTVNDHKISEYQEKLLNWLKRHGIAAMGTFKLARYNAPFTLPAFRRNELLIDVDMKDVDL